jgi:membrane protease YdiL (CAAX protease family)
MLNVKSARFTDVARDVLKQVGFQFEARHFIDPQYLVALLSGIVVVWFTHHWMPVFETGHQFQVSLLISIVIWQPFIEELMFRGIIQSSIKARACSGDFLPGISYSNVFASLLFVILHLITTSSYWALTLFVPSVVYGYFRDRFDSVIPSMVLHGFYNLYVVIGLLLLGSSIV